MSNGETPQRTRRLLVATEFRAVADRIGHFFSQRGYRVVIVDDGVQSLGAVQVRPPDALILDWDLPWGGGAGILACLREFKKSTQFPVIVLLDRFSQGMDLCAPVARCVHTHRVTSHQFTTQLNGQLLRLMLKPMNACDDSSGFLLIAQNESV